MAFGDFTVDRNDSKYVLGSSGSYVAYAPDEPAIEFNPDGSFKGLLVEPASTNEVPNGSATGSTTGVIGSGGALPTYWNIPSASGLTTEVIGTGTENGVNYIDIKASGTSTGTQYRVAFSGATQITADPSEVWTTSFFARTIALPNPYDQVLIAQNYRTAVAAFINSSASSLALTSSLARYEVTGTTVASTERIQPEIKFDLTNGNPYDFTFRIGWAQIEESPIATSPIPTSGSKKTRVKDDITQTGASSLIGQSEGTLYLEVDGRNATGTSQILLHVTDGGNDNGFHIAKLLANDYLVVYYRAGGSTIVLPAFPTNPLTSGVNKYAFTYNATSCRVFQNGSAGTEDTGLDASAMTTLTDIDLGQNYTAGNQANMHIRAVALYKERLSDAQCIALTS